MGKNFNATGGFGPWLVTTDDIPDPDALTVTTRLNGEQMQFGEFNDVAFNIPTLISYVSRALPWWREMSSSPAPGWCGLQAYATDLSHGRGCGGGRSEPCGTL
ncbi:MAG: hypothetical protein CM1200mP20_04310 [Pseudomonadota bacterium]|nr:MAG: hypothetical protein CM1200mP20_04310 [Pseudomonadota bacterium]